MAIASMKKIQIVFPSNKKEVVLELLQEKGVSQIDFFDDQTVEKYNIKQNNQEHFDCEYMLAETDFAIKFLEKYKETEKKSLLAKLREGKFLHITKDKYTDVVASYNYKDIIEECKKLEEELNFHQNKNRELSTELSEIGKWKDLSVNFSGGLDTARTKALVGTLRSDKLLLLKDDLQKQTSNFEISEVGQYGGEVQVVIIFLKENEEVIRKNLTSVGFNNVVFEGIEGTIANKMTKINKEVKFHTSNIKELNDRASTLSSEQSNLKIIFDHFNTTLVKQVNSEKLLNMKFVSVLQTWITVDHFDDMKKAMNKLSGKINLVEVDIKEKEEMPIILKNNNLIEPFESVTNIYGLPKHSDVDPTAWLSLSFLIFFGFCLSDAGYGLILTLLSVVAIKVLKIPRENQTLIRLIAYSGIFTFIIGALFGGWFGIDLDKLAPGVISNFLLKIRVINPITQPLILMYTAFAIGFIHILFGIFVKLYKQCKEGKYLDSVLDNGLWLAFLPTLVYWAISGNDIAKNFVLLFVVILVLTQGRKEKNIVAKFFMGVLSLYSLVGYFSDVLSYSRLLALGLATGVIAVIVNQIAGIVGDMIPYVGWIAMVLIIIAGHIFNIAINVLGSFIHSSRLEFVEFFGKFFEGGGKVFEPFNKRYKYIIIN